jgi:hypothetical protein
MRKFISTESEFLFYGIFGCIVFSSFIALMTYDIQSITLFSKIVIILSSLLLPLSGLFIFAYLKTPKEYRYTITPEYLVGYIIVFVLFGLILIGYLLYFITRH